MVKNYGLKPNGEIKPYWHSWVRLLVGIAMGVGCFFVSRYANKNIEADTFLHYAIFALRCLMIYIAINLVIHGIEGLTDTKRNIKWTTQPTEDELYKLIGESVEINAEKLLENIEELAYTRFQIIAGKTMLYVGATTLHTKYSSAPPEKTYFISLTQYSDYTSFAYGLRQIINGQAVRLVSVLDTKVSECGNLDSLI